MKFGTSGVRGLAVDLIGETTRLYVAAFARYLLSTDQAKPGARVFVGLDFRQSSAAMAQTAIEALQSAGLVGTWCGTVPTPAPAYHAMSQGSASLMVTGSHIPADRNGIKFYRPNGEIDKVDEADIIAWTTKITAQPHKLTPATYDNQQAQVEEKFFARNQIILTSGALSGLTVAVYQHSTVARGLLVDTLEFYSAKVTALGRSGTFVPVDTEAVSSETLALLTSWAHASRYDAIVSADGDGDRPFVADETGKPVRGDIIGFLTAEFLQADALVTPVTSNASLEKEFASQIIRTRVGSPYVIAGMNAAVAQGSKKVMGFEANGGVLTASAFEMAAGTLSCVPTRDSVLPILAVLNWLKFKNKPLSLALAERGFSATASGRLQNHSPQRTAFFIMHLMESPQNLSEFFQDFGKVAKTDMTDGLRVTLTNGNMIHYRPSGNAPELRCYTEVKSEPVAQDLLARALTAADIFMTANG